MKEPAINVEPIIGGAVGGTLAVASQFVASWLTARREVKVAERVAARNCLEAIYAIRHAVDYRVNGGSDVRLDYEYERKVDALRLALSSVKGEDIRERMAVVIRCLGATSAIQAFTSYTETSAVWALCRHSEVLFEAHLHDKKLPEDDGVVKAFADAVDEADAIMEEQYEEEYRRRAEYGH
ncbi:hypothetical protein [Lentzea sp. CC55]|uniref:hypothetical protein n=1 Tax=Lentzea sp. CC55 TaxID=2884909 RepID=UPI001F241420|nr:hypothetical protein [Lentzea sp. CC55]MCG8926148.1 hypothetical protein [Lentzea sp. CC55]